MIFQHTIDKVLSGEKTQTRRIKKTGEWFWFDCATIEGGTHAVFRDKSSDDLDDPKLIYRIGKTYSIQPGRGQKSVGRIEITGIRREDVRNISYEDVIAEGFNSPFVFLRTWVAMHDKPANTAWFKHSFADGDESGMISDAQGWMSWLKGTRPAERYQAWVLEFRLVEGA